MKTIRVIGKDGNGIRRVYGEGPSQDIAATRARDEAVAYVKRRPDTGPLDRWTFEDQPNRKD